MYQTFWDKFHEIKLATYYFQFYAVRAKRLKTWVSIVCTIASSAMLGEMVRSGQAKPLFAVVAFFFQLVSVLQPFFPYEKQYHAACYIYEDANQLAQEMEKTWRTIGEDTTDETLNEYVTSFVEKYERIEGRFSKADTFPQDMRLYNKALQNADRYLKGLSQ